MLEHFGPQNWWPAKTKFGIVLGALLTQRTKWENAARAVENLERHGLLDPKALADEELKVLRKLTKVAGFRTKAKWIRDFAKHVLKKYDGSLELLMEKPVSELRTDLLALDGIGKETADNIILYAGEKLIFPVDAYTQRIANRIGLVGARASYDELRSVIERGLPKDLEVYKEFRALFVRLGKTYCVEDPLCGPCPVKECNFGATRRSLVMVHKGRAKLTLKG